MKYLFLVGLLLLTGCTQTCVRAAYDRGDHDIDIRIACFDTKAEAFAFIQTLPKDHMVNFQVYRDTPGSPLRQ